MAPETSPTADDSQQVPAVNRAGPSRRRSAEAPHPEEIPTKRQRRSVVRDAPTEAPMTEDTQNEGDEEQTISPTADNAPAKTTTPRRRGRPPKASSQSQSQSQTSSTPSKAHAPAKSIFATPVKNQVTESTTPKRRAADRSARRKSARVLIENIVGDGRDSDVEEDDEVLVREIYDDSDGEDGVDDEGVRPLGLGEEAAVDAAQEGGASPLKTGRKRGRGKLAKSPTPPRDLPPHELYFAHNKPGRPKTSDNTLASLAMLTHDEYFSILNEHVDPHCKDIEYLEDLHAELFPQWIFELSQGYSICLYGFGSKRRLLHNFAKHLHGTHQARLQKDAARKTVVVNGYAPTATLREILTCVSSAVDQSLKPYASSPTAMLSSILAHLSTVSLILTIIINSVDAAPLRKTATQSILSQLASHPQINLVCSADTPDFSLLWDIGIRSAFNFVFHDCTTFAPFAVELDVIDEVHELLGRKARRVNGREGVAFVLKSLPENAKNLFQLLVGEVLIAMEEEGGMQDDEAAGVEYRIVYNKAVEEFICSSEMAFRTLLKEFHDHQMITSRKDALGTELLSVPFQKDELEAILEDLMS